MAQILLVDDEKVARSLYSDFLAGAGHDVTAVGSIAEAKEALLANRFALLVTDLLLPQSDGLSLLQFVRSTQPEVEVLVVTALDKVEPAVRAIKSGAADYLVKPVQPEVLAHAVNRALTQHKLLKENEALRQHVALLEAGQRIATTLDREKLFTATTGAFQGMCGAAAVAVYIKESGQPLDLAIFEGQPTLGADLLNQVSDVVRAQAPGSDPAGQSIALDGLPFARAYLVPVYEGEVLFGAVVLFFESAPTTEAMTGAAFLARHLGLALKNLGKFTAVEDLVYLDDLTHLFNSRYFQLVLTKEVKRAEQSDKPFALLFLDLDYFKSVNDTHGHLVGSKLLVEVGRVLKNCVRDLDVVCRWGGDEYVILLRGTDSGGALKVAERIRRSIEGHRFLAREGYSLTISTCIGIAAFPEHAQDQETLVDFADRAMYRGKKTTRNIIYMAAKNLEATPASRHQTAPPPGTEKPQDD